MEEHTIKLVVKRNCTLNKFVIAICITIYLIYQYIVFKTNDSTSTMILLGVDYKTFTLGLNEYFRLITSGFCHFNLLHLLFNMISLLTLGSFIENVYGSKKYLIYLLGGILLGSLTSGVLNTNIIESGISSALYTFLVIFVLYLFIYHGALPFNFFFILLTNIYINFLPNVAWQAHLGGAIAGLIFFFIDYYKRINSPINKYSFILLLVITFTFMFYKYYSTKNDIVDYKGTDFIYVEYIDKYVPFLKDNYQNKIYNYYMNKR